MTASSDLPGKGIQNIKITVFKSQINIFIPVICIAIYTNTSNTVTQTKKKKKSSKLDNSYNAEDKTKTF